MVADTAQLDRVSQRQRVRTEEAARRSAVLGGAACCNRDAVIKRPPPSSTARRLGERSCEGLWCGFARCTAPPWSVLVFPAAFSGFEISWDAACAVSGRRRSTHVPGVPERVAPGLRPNQHSVRAGAHRDASDELAVVGVEAVDLRVITTSEP